MWALGTSTQPAAASDNDELDLYAFLNTSIGALDVGIGFTRVFLPRSWW